MLNNRKSSLPCLTASIALRVLLALTPTLGVFTIAIEPILASQPAPRNRLTQLEIRLLRDLIDGHNFAIEMSEVCLRRATLQELKSLCRQVITAQQQEIQTMQSWLSNWYGISYSPTSNRFGQNVINQLSRLSGDDFNIMFMKTLTSHHWGAIIFAGEIIDRSYHVEFVNLGANVVTQQTREINQLRSWLKKIYNIDYVGAAAAGSAVDPPNTEHNLLYPESHSD
ncbi:DUF305 domain-containing protein [Nostoc sp. B(2019)]|uniref:DUF305 domain-containing protein n=1 Tax=Nostoc cf. edaphicum LEGE 07299 TaxID=2777974 RepID=A0ABR9TT53_9NOSO|nr:DUF305 domain-containing protein [Nostoc edaphicum]MBE9103571.1 DUF305 domain-containing protein [Nostoc cf. edaphicum LEGE 07299]NDJ24427.1 DUF305 domain-containing protein [Nostoc sp. B(2019)]